MKLFRSKIDKLARRKRVCALKKEQILHKMFEKNSARETKIKKLENKCYNDKVVAERRALELDRQIDKIVREVTSEQIYVNEVAENEKDDYKEMKLSKRK